MAESKEDDDVQIIDVRNPEDEVVSIDGGSDSDDGPPDAEAEVNSEEITRKDVTTDTVDNESKPSHSEYLGLTLAVQVNEVNLEDKEQLPVPQSSISNTMPVSIDSEFPRNSNHDNTKNDKTEISTVTMPTTQNVLLSTAFGLASAESSEPGRPAVKSNGVNPSFLKSASVESESQLNQAAIKLLQRLEFKNPGRKQFEYGIFNPEESEREKKKLRRFQSSKPKAGVCYKEDGTLLDDRDICDCLSETCPGCFYPCLQCCSTKCGPTCRCNRKWVYDYIEDEGRTYRVEFPEGNLGT